MKKKISVTLCALALMNALAGCAQTAAVTLPTAESPAQTETVQLEAEESMVMLTQPPKEEKEGVQMPASDQTAEETQKPTRQEEAKPVKTAEPKELTPKPTKETDASAPTKEPETSKPTTAPTKQPAKPTPQPEKPTVTPAPTPEPTPEPTSEPTPVPAQEPQMEVMGDSFNNAVLAAVNEARALQGNPALSLDSGLCAKALEHAKEMARQGKAFHSCGGVESVSDSSGGGRTIGARSAIHASDLELNAGLTRLGAGSVKINGKQYTCVIGR